MALFSIVLTCILWLFCYVAIMNTSYDFMKNLRENLYEDVLTYTNVQREYLCYPDNILPHNRFTTKVKQTYAKYQIVDTFCRPFYFAFTGACISIYLMNTEVFSLFLSFTYAFLHFLSIFL